MAHTEAPDRPRRPRRLPGRRGNLDHYFTQIAAIPIPDQAEVAELLAVIRDDGRPASERMAARDRLLTGNLRLVVHLAQYFEGRGLDLDDLIAAGNMGLFRAVELYDAGFGMKFSGYAAQWIKASIRRTLVNLSRPIRVPMQTFYLVGRYQRAVTALSSRLGRHPKPEEIRAEMGLNIQKWARLTDALAASGVAGIGDSPVAARGESPVDAAARAEAPGRLRRTSRPALAPRRSPVSPSRPVSKNGKPGPPRSPLFLFPTGQQKVTPRTSRRGYDAPSGEHHDHLP